jgi:hypothetical protein
LLRTAREARRQFDDRTGDAFCSTETTDGSTCRRAAEQCAQMEKRGVNMKLVLVIVLLVLAGSAAAAGCPPGSKYQCAQGKGHVVCSCH